MEKLGQWQKVKEIVGSVLERPAAERRAYLDQLCSHDSELRAEVESLISAFPDSAGFLEDLWPVSSAEAETQRQVIGPYRLLKELGVGGMGQVWLAEQTEPIRRQVALKLIRAGMFDSATVQRFKAERQSLAIMDHPTIAKVFDAGTTPAGQPYLVMEYVDGRPITDYCDFKKLTIRERIQLFMRVCEGVQHAHQKAIIHRDLKPSNVLVVEVDGKPMPRIIDFGLAKATAPLVPGETLFTQMGAFLGTPGYMSPEQADPGVHDVDTRTDVYSLGDSVRTADRVFAVRCSRVEEAAAGGVSSETARRRSAGTEREDQNESGDLGEQSGSAPYGPKTTDESFTRRLGLDDDEGPGERPRTPVRDTVGARRRY
jgi:non-specific serine/threonine protein kinase/serine/threonine-protein kinase